MRVVLRRAARKLRLAAETVRQLRTAELPVVRGGMVEVTDECPSEYTYCAKYCSD